MQALLKLHPEYTAKVAEYAASLEVCCLFVCLFVVFVVVVSFSYFYCVPFADNF
jgi:hypothetical protein